MAESSIVLTGAGSCQPDDDDILLDHDLKVLVQVKDLALHDAHAIVKVSLKGSTLHELGHIIDLAIFSQLYDLTIQLLKLLFKLFVPRYHFFSDQLLYLDFRSE